MIWLLLNISILTIVYLWPSKNFEIGLDEYNVSKIKRKWICVVGSVSWIFLSGLRHVSIGADTEAYEYLFQRTAFEDWEYLFTRLTDKFFGGVEDIVDPGFFIFNKFLSVFIESYQVYLMVFAVIFFISFGRFVYKHSSNPYTSYLLFSCLFYSFYAITGLRQTLATALVVCFGFKFIKERKLIRFLIVSAIGITIHLSSACFIPFYFVSRIKLNKISFAIWWGAIGASFVFRYQFLELMQSIAGYERYTDFEGAGAGIFMFLLLAVAGVATVFYSLLQNEKNEDKLRVYTNAILTACLFVPLSLINQSLMRIVYYYALFLMFILPELFNMFSKKGDKKVFEIAISMVMIALLVMNNPTYKFFWQ